MSEKKKVWLITGATAGLGKALAERVLQAGDLVIGTTRRKQALVELEALGKGHTKAVVLDPADPFSAEAVVRGILQQYGQIDVLVNNAGYGLMGAVEEISEQEAFEQMNVNLFAPLRLVRAVLPFLRQQGAGHIIQISSRLALAGAPFFGWYAASKFALEGITDALTKELAPFHIHVTSVLPGPLRTEFFGSSLVQARHQIDSYRAVFGDRNTTSRTRHGKQEGDPRKAAEAIYQVTRMQQPPLRLPLTVSTLDALRQRITDYQQDLLDWEQTARDVAF